MIDEAQALAVTLFSEILTADQLLRNRLSRILPNGMEISHFSVLNHLDQNQLNMVGHHNSSLEQSLSIIFYLPVSISSCINP